MLKDRNLELGIRSAINLTVILTDELEANITQLNTILYNLNKKKPTNKKSIKELFSDRISEENLSRESNEKSLKQNRD